MSTIDCAITEETERKIQYALAISLQAASKFLLYDCELLCSTSAPLKKTPQFNQQLKVTAREKDCLRLLMIGKTNKMIAKSLNLSVRTVDKHLDNLFRKAGVNSRLELFFFINTSATMAELTIDEFLSSDLPK